MRTLFAALVAAVVLTGGPASALTVNEIVELSAADVSADTIIAQLQADGSRFVLNAELILKLKRAGVDEAVIQAMIRSGQEPPTPNRATDSGRSERVEVVSTPPSMIITSAPAVRYLSGLRGPTGYGYDPLGGYIDRYASPWQGSVPLGYGYGPYPYGPYRPVTRPGITFSLGGSGLGVSLGARPSHGYDPYQRYGPYDRYGPSGGYGEPRYNLRVGQPVRPGLPAPRAGNPNSGSERWRGGSAGDRQRERERDRR